MATFLVRAFDLEPADPAGFVDIEGSSHEANINALAAANITVGCSQDPLSYCPNRAVSRAEMATFIARALALLEASSAAPDDTQEPVEFPGAGVDVTAGRADWSSGFFQGELYKQLLEELGYNVTDPARLELGPSIAYIAMAQGDLDYWPNSWYPAHYGWHAPELPDGTLVGDHVTVVGEELITGGLQGFVATKSFADTYGVYTMDDLNRNAEALAAFDATDPVPGDGTTFNPRGTVPRRNMAQFITRTMAHSNARPAGLTAQVSGGDITVSVRDADFAPVVNQPVDAFKASAAFESKAFKGDGTCSRRTTLIDGATKCEIDGADPVTLSDGNTALAQLDAETIGKGLTVWIWAGDAGDKYGTSTDAYELSVVPGDTATPTADGAILKDDIATGVTRVHYGVTVTITIQLQGGEQNDRVDAGPAPDAEIAYQVVTEVYPGATETGAPQGDANTRDTQDVEIDDDGSGTFTVTVSDPDARPGQANSNTVRYTVTGPTFEPTENTANIVFSDDAPVVAAVKVDVSPFQSAPGANTKTGSAATVTVTDQVGRPFKGAGIIMISDNDDSVLPTKARITSGNGQVRIGYSYTGGASDEALTATYTSLGADGEVGGGDDVTVTGTATAFWVTSTQEETQDAATVLSADLDDNQVIVDDTGGEVVPTSVNYDGTDFFTVDGTPSSMETFEEALGKALARNAELVAGGGVAETLTLAWQSYVYDDPDDIASFTLVTE